MEKFFSKSKENRALIQNASDKQLNKQSKHIRDGKTSNGFKKNRGKKDKKVGLGLKGNFHILLLLL